MDRDVRTLLYCKVVPGSQRNHQGAYRTICEKYNQCFFAFGGFDAFAVYQTPIATSKGNWMLDIYNDKIQTISEIDQNVIYQQIHMVSQTDQTAFWSDSALDSYPYFVVSLVYGVQHDTTSAYSLCEGESSIYEHVIRDYLSQSVKDEPNIDYAVYNGVTCADVVILWRTNCLECVLDIIAGIEFGGKARKTISTLGFLMDSSGQIHNRVFEQLENHRSQRKLSLCIQGSIRDMQLVKDLQENKVLPDKECFTHFGKNDFSASIDVTSQELASQLRKYYTHHSKISEAFWEISTEFRTSFIALLRGSNKIKYPTNILSEIYKTTSRLYHNKEGYGIQKYPWSHALLEQLATQYYMDQHPVLHGSSYLFYESLQIINEYFEGKVSDFEDPLTRDLLLNESEDRIFRFLRNWDQLTEQIARNDYGMLNTHSSSHTIHFSIPLEALEFYHAFLRRVVDCLIGFDIEKQCLPQNFEYGFLLSPNSRPRFRVASVFRTDFKYRKSQKETKTWPEKQVYILEMPIKSIFTPMDLFVPAVHECFHIFGDTLRSRNTRQKRMALFIAQTLITACGLEYIKNDALQTNIARYIYGNGNTQLYAKEARSELLNNTKDLLNPNNLDKLFRELGSGAYYLYSNQAIQTWLTAGGHTANAFSESGFRIASVIEACDYFFRECYADAMTITLLGLSPDEYLMRFCSEIIHYHDEKMRMVVEGSGYRGNSRGLFFSSSGSCIAQRIAIVLISCFGGEQGAQDKCFEAIHQMEKMDDGVYSDFTTKLELYYTAFVSPTSTIPSEPSVFPVSALQYVREYIEHTTQSMLRKGSTSPQYNGVIYTLSDLKQDFSYVIRNGNMFGERFYRIIEEYHHHVRTQLNINENER